MFHNKGRRSDSARLILMSPKIKLFCSGYAVIRDGLESNIFGALSSMSGVVRPLNPPPSILLGEGTPPPFRNQASSPRVQWGSYTLMDELHYVADDISCNC